MNYQEAYQKMLNAQVDYRTAQAEWIKANQAARKAYQKLEKAQRNYQDACFEEEQAAKELTEQAAK